MEGRFESTGIPESRETKERRDMLEEITESLSDADMALFNSIAALDIGEEERRARIQEFNDRMAALPAEEGRVANRINAVPVNFGAKVIVVSKDEYGRFSIAA
jgi:hypothetical protein